MHQLNKCKDDFSEQQRYCDVIRGLQKMGSLSSCYLGADNIQALEFSLLAAFVFSTKGF